MKKSAKSPRLQPGRSKQSDGLPLKEAMKEIRERIKQRWKSKPVSDAEVARMRAAGIAVPESLAEVKALLEEAERDPREIPIDEAFRQIRRRARKKLGLDRDA